MATASLLVRVRTTGAAGMRALGRGLRELTTLTRQLDGATRDANGRLRMADGRFVSNRQRLTLLGRAALGAYEGINRLTTGLGNASGGLAVMAAKLALVASLIVPVTVTVGNLLPLLMVIPAAAVGGALAITTLVLAFKGLGGAIEAAFSGDKDEIAEAFKKITPSARHFVVAVLDVAAAWRNVRNEVQERFFAGAADDLRQLTATFAPMLTHWLPMIADGFARARRELTIFFTSAEQRPVLEFIFANLVDGVNGFLRAISPLAMALTDILEVAAPKFARLGNHVGDLAGRFAAFIRSAKESGDLRDWLDRAVATFQQLGRIVGNIGEIFSAIFKTGQEDGASFLTTLEQLTQKTADWLNTERGKQFIAVLGFIANALLTQLAVIGVLTNAYIAFVNFMRQIWAGVLTVVLGAFNQMLLGAVKAFGWIPGIGGKLKQAQAEFDAFASGVIRALRGIPDETVNLYVNVKQRGTPGVTGSNERFNLISGRRAAGGPVAAGRTYWVGERGPEMVTFGAAGTVHNARDSARMAAGGGGGGRPVQVNVNGSRMSGLDSMFATWFEKAVRDGLITINA